MHARQTRGRFVPTCLAAVLLAASGARVVAQDGSITRSPSTTSNREESRIPRLPLFFPPHPPPLGRAIPATGYAQGAFAAPGELALYINEIFYPALATRLLLRSVPASVRRHLEQYRTAKTALQAELRAELERLRDAEPTARVQALAALSRQQTPRIAALEQQAEKLRRDLITADTHWSAAREWQLGDKPSRGYSPIEIAQVMRGYAFYQNGLLPAQRRLLREIALELQLAADNREAAAAAQPYLFFPPEPARVLLPDDAPAEVASRMTSYQSKKSVLKKELYDAVHSYDGERLKFLSGTIRNLAEKQAPALAELETLAEEIRTGLAAIPEPARVSERSSLPVALQERISRLVAELTQAQKDASEKLQRIRADTSNLPIVVNHRFDGDGMKYVVVPSSARRMPTPDELARIQAVRNEYAAVADEYGRRFERIVAEKDAIAADAQQVLGTSRPDAVNQAIATAVRVSVARENEDAYREYRLAVFQPGMSPEQRRLLFDAVVENLGLPLPPGELQPSNRGKTW